MKNLKLLLAFIPSVLALQACDSQELDAARLEAAEDVDFRAAGSCSPDACGQYIASNSCQCDDACVQYGDCCDDVDAVCNAPVDECESNDDCDEFCGWNEANTRVCKPWATEGESCEGFVLPAFRAQCAPELECEFSEPTNDIPGTCVVPSGDECESNDDCEEFCGWDEDNNRVCKPWAQEGESCEGFVLPAFRATCAPGLECEFSEPTFDVPGTCVQPDEGEFCGGIAGIQCPVGQHCELQGDFPDAGGTCQPGSGLGQMCGGIAGFQCHEGLNCFIEETDIADAAGECVEACAVAGCSGQVCTTVSQAPNIITTCEVLPEYACFAQTTCGNFGPGGACQREQNDEYLACLDSFNEPAGDSCEGSCGGQAADGCYCDDLCSFYGDCCGDKVDVCG